MISLLIELGGLAAVGYLGMLGASYGTIPATVRALQLFTALVLAMLFFEPLAGVIDPVLGSLGGRDFSAVPWAMFLSFVLLYGLFLAVAIIVTPPDLTVQPDDPDELPRREKIGGGALGALAGMLLVGTVLIVLSMFPLPGWLHIRTHGMYYDLGAVSVRALTPFVGALAVYGEPLAEPGDSSARLSSEVWADVDGDGKRGDDDFFVDRDGSGGFSEKTSYRDLDGNYQRRIGLLEKYAVWSWDDLALNVTHVGPPAPPPAPEEGSAGPAPAAPPAQASAEEDIPGKKPPGDNPAAAAPKGKEEEPADDF